MTTFHVSKSYKRVKVSILEEFVIEGEDTSAPEIVHRLRIALDEALVRYGGLAAFNITARLPAQVQVEVGEPFIIEGDVP